MDYIIDMEKNQKTIFITAFFGLIARNVLATDFLELVKQDRNLKVIILTPLNKKERYQKEFAHDNVVVEGVVLKSFSRLERFLEVIFHNLSDTAAWRIHRLVNVKKDKKYLSAPLLWLLSQLGYLFFVRRVFRWLDYHLLDKNRFKEYFEKYKPQLVFSTDVFEPNDVDVLRGAISRKIYTIGMVRSWDNITTKGLNRVITDKLIVNTESVKEEAVKLNDVKLENVSVVGVPHYDNYIVGPTVSKDELFNELDLDLNKKTIFFAPPADLYTGHSTISGKTLRLLSNIDAQIIVRLPVVGDVNIGKFGQPIPNKIAVDKPASSQNFSDANIFKSEDNRLKNLLYYSDVVVAFASTLAIDAIVFGKPVVFIGFDDELRPYWDSLVRYYDYDHQRKLLEMGGIRLAKNSQELETLTKNYLENPELDEPNRRKIIKERCWKLDGHSGERLASVILTNLD